MSQLVRSPGVYFSRELDKTSDKDVFIAKIIPSRGAWLEFDVDKKDTVGVRIDRKRRQHVTVFLKALGWTTDEILEGCSTAPRSIQLTLEKDHVETAGGGPRGHLPEAAAGRAAHGRVRARRCSTNLFFNPKRYDLAKVGRYKVDKKLGPPTDALRRSSRPSHKALAEQDNPDKKAWEQDKYRVLSPRGEGRAGGGRRPSTRPSSPTRTSSRPSATS